MDRHHHDAARRLAVDLEGSEQFGIDGNIGPAIGADRIAGAGDQEHQRHPGIAHDVAQGIDPIVSAAIRQHQRLRVVNADETGEIAARRAVDPLGSDGGERGERRLFDEGPIERGDVVGDFHGRGVVGDAVDGLQLLDRFDHRHSSLLVVPAIRASLDF